MIDIIEPTVAMLFLLQHYTYEWSSESRRIARIADFTASVGATI